MSSVAILYAPGTNCHEETAAALARAGLEGELLLLRDLLDGRRRLNDFNAAVIPGGFSYGDHLGAGRIFATMLVAQLRESFAEFLARQRPLLGICNGFQILAEAGVLPAGSPGKRSMALLENQSAHFEDRKVRLLVESPECLWTRGLAGRVLEMPSAHGEGRSLFAGDDAGSLRVALRYAAADAKPTLSHPENPNGSPGAVAGITNSTGFALGLMPHPERASLPAHESQDGLELFKNLARWLGARSA